jgi:hypothetical protein
MQAMTERYNAERSDHKLLIFHRSKWNDRVFTAKRLQVVHFPPKQMAGPDIADHEIGQLSET